MNPGSGWETDVYIPDQTSHLMCLLDTEEMAPWDLKQPKPREALLFSLLFFLPSPQQKSLTSPQPFKSQLGCTPCPEGPTCIFRAPGAINWWLQMNKIPSCVTVHGPVCPHIDFSTFSLLYSALQRKGRQFRGRLTVGCFPGSCARSTGTSLWLGLAKEGTDGRLMVGGRKKEATSFLPVAGFPKAGASLLSPADSAMTYVGFSLYYVAHP